mgnify:CR=1 FL=1|tara:strand:- start:28 stop:585 length:558 start_codon:yes stop_codon:yes gene_type:complete
MDHNNFIYKYLKKYHEILNDTNKHQKIFIKIYNILKKYKNKKKVHIFGNGGSAAIASHFSMDLTNNSNIRCYNYNEPALITCYSNDFKYENWISKVIEKYGDKDDLLILISSGGMSKNMINAVKTAKKLKFYKIITLTGFSKSNNLKKIGDFNLWVNSKDFNIVENIHQIWLLMIVDMIKIKIKA